MSTYFASRSSKWLMDHHSCVWHAEPLPFWTSSKEKCTHRCSKAQANSWNICLTQLHRIIYTHAYMHQINKVITSSNVGQCVCTFTVLIEALPNYLQWLPKKKSFFFFFWVSSIYVHLRRSIGVHNFNDWIDCHPNKPSFQRVWIEVSTEGLGLVNWLD